MPAKNSPRLDNEEGLFPGPNHPGKKHQEKPVHLPVDRSFDLSTKDHQLLSYSAFSASSSDFPLGISASVPSKREVVGGLIQREKRFWSA